MRRVGQGAAVDCPMRAGRDIFYEDAIAGHADDIETVPMPACHPR